MAKTTTTAKSDRKANNQANRSKKSPASPSGSSAAMQKTICEIGTATAHSLRVAADQIDALVAARAKRDPACALQALHAVMAGPLVGGVMIDLQDAAHPLN